MRIFVYEFITGGGMWSAGLAPPSGSLLREGNAMLRALTTDLARLPGAEIIVTWDERLPSPPANCVVYRIGSVRQEHAAFAELASNSEGVIVIAPELGGALLQRVEAVAAAGGVLFSPGAEFVEIASDKHECCRRLESAGVPTPYGILLAVGDELPRDFPYPAVLKPRYGAGSENVLWVPNADSQKAKQLLSREVAREIRDGLREPMFPWRLEAYRVGRPASVAMLCGPADLVILPACRQNLSDDGRFRYLGGTLPLSPAMNQRAATLGAAAVAALPATVGYVGIDLIFGDAEDGSQDTVIEVNPRLTSSYVGIRHAIEGNLGEIMLEAARGVPILPTVRFGRIDFSADGNISRMGGLPLI